MSVLVVAPLDSNGLKAGVRSVVRAAQALDSEIDLLLVGQTQNAVKSACKLPVRAVIFAKAPSSPEVIAEAASKLVKEKSYTHVLFDNGTASKSAMPRLAATFRVPAVSEVTAVVAKDTFKRFIYAGNVLATVRIEATPFVMTVRATAFTPVEETNGEAPCVDFAFEASCAHFEFVSCNTAKNDRPDLVTAKKVLSAGRGVIDEAGFAELEKLADKLGAAVGSTRALVDAQIAPSETQVGQTGKVVAPELYMAFGISGAIQHLAGMKDSKVVVAVNNDPEAPIFEVSDYYLVADAVETIKELERKL